MLVSPQDTQIQENYSIHCFLLFWEGKAFLKQIHDLHEVRYNYLAWKKPNKQDYLLLVVPKKVGEAEAISAFTFSATC